MARAGRFGRLPRSYQSLSSIIASEARNLQSQRDSAIMDAWRNGGTFQGENVTDESMLAYWNKRLAGLKPGTQAYESLKSNILQLDFAIADSKSDLAYKQGTITAEQRAQFFLDWAKKVPQGSELWRTLQKNAAQFIQAAKAGSAASSSKAAADARAAADQATYNNYEAAGDYLLNVLTQAARSMGLIPGVNPETGSAGTLADMGLNTAKGGIMQMPALLAQLSKMPEVVDTLKKLDPSFSGTITQAYLEKVLKSKVQGLTIRRDSAAAAGDTSGDNGTVKLDKMIGQYNEWGRIIGAWDVGQSYETARNQWLKIWQDPNAGPQAKLDAWAKYQQTLVSLANDPNTDAQTASTLLAEANGDTTSKTLHENFTGIATPTASGTSTDKPSGDNADTQASVTRLTNEAQMLADGSGVMTYGTVTGGVFKADPNGKQVGVISTGEAQMSGGQMVPVTQPDGSVQMMWVTPVDVKVVAKGADGTVYTPINADGQGASNVVAKAYIINTGGKQQIIYQYTDGTGKTRYTTATPWADGAVVQVTPGGIVVDLSSVVQSDAKTTITNNANGKTGFIVDTAWNPVRNAAGVNYYTDTETLIASLVRSLPDAEAKAIADAIRNDPAKYQALLASESVWNPDGTFNAQKYAELATAMATAGNADKHSTVDPSSRRDYNAQYDNLTNNNAFAPVTLTVDTKVPGSGNTALDIWNRTSTRAGESWSVITSQMTVPGRFGTPLTEITREDGSTYLVPWNDTGTADTGVKIRLGSQLTVPKTPDQNPPYTTLPTTNPATALTPVDVAAKLYGPITIPEPDAAPGITQTIDPAVGVQPGEIGVGSATYNPNGGRLGF
jgi:hypothetical protein